MQRLSEQNVGSGLGVAAAPTKSIPGRFRLTYGILATALVAGRLLGMYIRHPYDDAFITYRYALNLASGHGLVYNIGERVLGTTSPLFAAILGLPAMLGLDLPAFTPLLNAILDCLTLLLLFWWAKRNSAIMAATLFAIVFAGEPVLVRVPVGGMETSLFLLCSVATVLLFHRERYALAAGLGAVTYFVRPEAVLLLGVLIAQTLMARKYRSAFLMAVLSLLVIGLPLAVVWRTYGSPLPHSVTTKALHAHGTLLQVLRAQFWLNPLHVVALPPAAWGAVVSFKRWPVVRTLTIWCGIYLAAYVAVRPQCWGWYFYSTDAVKFLLAALGCADLMARNARLRRLTPLSLAVTGGVLVVLSGTAIAVKAGRSQVGRNVYAPLRAWFEQHPSANRTIAAGDIGAVGYFSRAHIYDLAGLVTTNVPESGLSEVLCRLPDYLFLGVFNTEQEIAHAPGVAERYRPIARFARYGDTALTLREDEVSDVWKQDYILYERSDPPLSGRTGP